MHILDKNQVAEKLQISTRQVNNLVSKGLFPPGVKQGKKLLWLSVVVERYLEGVFKSQLDFESMPKASATSCRFMQQFDAD